MSSASAAFRFRLGVVVAISLVLALGSFWVLQVQRKRAEDAAPKVQRVAPDFYVNTFTFVKMAKSHTARYNIAGALLVHHPKDDSYEITQPVIHQLSNGRPPMLMKADRAMVNSDNSEVNMIGNVDIDRPAAPQSDHFHLSSPTLTLLPDDDIMKTEAPVQLLLGTATLNGTGMVANNATRQFNLAHNVHGTRPPRPAQ